MAIEFRCTNCGKLLRTGDGTAGKQARCPECDTVMIIPAATAGSQPPHPSSLPPAPFDPSSPESSRSQPPGEIVPSALDLGNVFGRTWAIFKPNWGQCLLVVLAVWGLSLAANITIGFIPFVGTIIPWVLQTWLYIGMALFFLKIARGQNAEVAEIFTGGPFLLKIILASILLSLIVLGVGLACVGPLSLIASLISKDVVAVFFAIGAVIAFFILVYVSLALSQYYYLIIDRNMDVIDAFKLSNELMRGNKLTLLGIGVLSIIIMFIAALPLLLGLLVAIPYFTLMYAVIYLSVTGQPMADERIDQLPAVGSTPSAM